MPRVSKATTTIPKKTKNEVVKSKKPKEPVKTEPVESVVSDTMEKPVVENKFDLAPDFLVLTQKMQEMTTLMSALRSEFRTLEKKATREMKAAAKATAKRKYKQGNRSPSGFVKPTLISKELAAFLNKPVGSELARTDVTREINQYIRANSLQDKTNGRKICADTKLSKLLKLGKNDELTYFNLQKYMSPHFAKSGQPPLNDSA
tara:strand:+ start:23155 stop:23766 length:612 start_codon:yes stop_codon:yes gene_type:complete